MTFEVVDTERLHPSMRWKIFSDAGTCVAEVEYRTWADHICKLLNRSGEDHTPTPNQVDDEDAQEVLRRQARYAEEEEQARAAGTLTNAEFDRFLHKKP